MFTEHLVMSQGRHGGSESVARAPCGLVLGCGVAVDRAAVWAVELCTGAMSPGTGTFLSCSPRHWCCFYFLCSFIFSALLLQRGQVPSFPLAQGRLQHLPSCCLHKGTRQIQQWHHTAASPSPRSTFTFSWLYFGLNDFWGYALLILKCWILKSRLH